MHPPPDTLPYFSNSTNGPYAHTVHHRHTHTRKHLTPRTRLLVTRRAKKVVPRFLGGKMTPEIKAALPHLSGITTEHARGVIKLVTDNIKGSDFTAEQAEEMAGALETDVSQRWV